MKPSHDAIFVGREEELQELLKYAREAFAGQKGVAFITGEAGVGKTTLVQELFRRLRAEHADIVIAAAQCKTSDASYLPFRTILETLAASGAQIEAAGEIATGKSAKVRESVLSIISDVGTDIMGIFLPTTLANVAGKGSKTLFGGLLGKAPKDLSGITAPKDLDRVQIYGWYARVMKNIAQKFPLVLFIDDLHWADDSSLNLLLHLGLEIEKDRLFVIGTYHPHEAKPGSLLLEIKTKLGRYGAREFNLDLSEEKPADLAKATRFTHDYLLAQYGANFSDHFEQLLVTRTEGNALFLTEILKDMEDQGQIRRVTPETGVQTWELVGSLDQIAEHLPERVENAIKSRIDRLEQDLREILDYASVQGDDFIAQVIAKVKTVDEWQLIDELTDKLMTMYQLIHELGEQPLPNGACVDAFSFKHNLIREYVYAQLPKAKKRRIHAQIGECLEKLYAPNAEQIAAALAIHFAQAHAPEKAVLYGLHAAQDANARSGASEAVRFAKIGLEALETRKAVLPPNEYADTKIRLLLELAKAEENGGDPQEQKDHIQIGIEYLENNLCLLDSVSDKLDAEVYYQLGKLYYVWHGKNYEAKEYLEKAIELYSRYDDQKNVGEILFTLSEVYVYLPPSEAEESRFDKANEAAKKSLIIGEQLQDIGLQAKCLNRLAGRYNSQNFMYAQQCWDRAIKLFEDTSIQADKRLKIEYLNTMADINQRQSKFKTAIEYLKESIKFSQEIDLPEPWSSHVMGCVYERYINLQKEAQDTFESRILGLQKLQRKFGNDLFEIGAIFIRQGKWGKAEECILKSIPGYAENLQSGRRIHIGYMNLIKGHYAQAETEFILRLEVLQKYKDAPSMLESTQIAKNYFLLGNINQCKKYLEIAQNSLKKETCPLFKALALYLIAEIFNLLGEYDFAKYNSQQSIDWFLANAEYPEGLVAVAEARLIMGKILVDMGDFQEAIPYLNKAQTAFEICGHYALGETLLYLGKAHVGLGGVIFRRQAKAYIIQALAEFERLELRHKEQEAREVLRTL